MRKVFKYIGIVVLMGFSFFYTDKIAKFMNNQDEVMKSINEYAEKNNTKCVEGYITEEGVVLGVNGNVVDTDLSYAEMKGMGFKEELIEYKEEPCVVSETNNRDHYIIKGNSAKKSVTLIIDVSNGKNIESIVNVSKLKDVKLSIMVNSVYLENNKEYVLKLINSGYDILYKGKSENELKEFLKILSSLKKEISTYCIYDNDEELLNYCYKRKINTVKTLKKYDSNYLSNIKANIDEGDFYILKESKLLKEEIGVTINYIRSRGLKVITLSEHLKKNFKMN